MLDGGRVIDAPVGDVDLLPTLLELVSGTAPTNLDGSRVSYPPKRDRRRQRPL